MERKTNRVSAYQWDLALDFFERNSQLLRGYNNSSRGRELSQRLWRELADLLNAEGSGATKTPKDWATYFNNFKSKLKKMVSDFNTEVTATGGGPSQAESLSQIEQRFLSIMGAGFGQGARNVRVNPFPNMTSASQAQDTSAAPEVEVQQELEVEEIMYVDAPYTQEPSISGAQQLIRRESPPAISGPLQENIIPTLPTQSSDAPPLPRPIRRNRRYHTRPMAPLDEARRILSQVELQRAAADSEQARALQLIGQSLERLAVVAERFINMHSNITQ